MSTRRDSGADAVPQVADEQIRAKPNDSSARRRSSTLDSIPVECSASARGSTGNEPTGAAPSPQLRLPPTNARESLTKLLQSSRVATHHDSEGLEGALKSNIYSVKVLGEGAFGIVDLVVVERPQGDNLLCVRKKLLKKTATNSSDPDQEIEFMEACEGCNFVVQKWSHVAGLYDLTLLLEYCPYNTLQHLLSVVSELRSKPSNGCAAFISDTVLKLNRWQGLTEDEARFYIGCTALGLHSLHARGMLHRDLKPANCLIADNRYLKVGDLGLVKVLGEDGKAYSRAGTPGYMAPEVYHSQGKASGGYGYPADIWSLGVMLWEVVDGLLPRWAYTSWYWTRLHFPERFSPELRDLLTKMLDKSPKKRLTLRGLKDHPWFASSNFDWDALGAQTMVAPEPKELHNIHIHSSLLPAQFQ